jgi:hypothetical protein
MIESSFDKNDKSPMPTKLTNDILSAAIEGFEAQKARIDDQIRELRTMLSGGPADTGAPQAPTGKRKKFSAAARTRMKEAQQLRWAKVRGEAEPPAQAAAKPAKAKRKLSAAGRKAIQEALRRRWALKRAESAKTATKKAAPSKAVKKAARVKKATAKKAAAAAPGTTATAAQ